MVRGTAFGLLIESELALPGLREPLTGVPGVALRLAASADGVVRRWSGAAEGANDARTVLDDLAYSARRGAAGDVLATLGEGRVAAYHLDPGARTLTAWLAQDARALRVLMDSVLATVASEHGYELLHATAVRLGDGVVAVSAPSGGGKSTLGAALAARGRPVFADDLVAIGRSGEGRPIAHPAPALTTLDRSLPVPGGAGALAELGEERWLELTERDPAPASLLALVLLDRAREGDPVVERLAPSPHAVLAALLPHRSRGERARRAFELACDLAEAVPLLALRAGPEVPASVLATSVERAVIDLGHNPAPGNR